MPSKSSGNQKGGKRLRFPPGVSVEASPVPWGLDSPARLHNIASQTDHEEIPVLTTPGIPEVMAAISSCQSVLTSKIEEVQMDVGLIRQDLDKIRTRVAETERRVGDVEDTVTDHAASIRALQTKVRALEYRAEDAENRSRRNNLRIVGLPEGVEGRSPALFIEELLRSLLPAAQLSPHFAVERAHRVPSRPGPEGAPPRTFILRLLNYRDRDELLRAARAAGTLPYHNGKLLLFPDYTIETQRQRRSFDNIKAALRVKGIKYSVLFPAKLHVVDGETVRFFTAPKDAAAWLEALPP